MSSNKSSNAPMISVQKSVHNTQFIKAVQTYQKHIDYLERRANLETIDEKYREVYEKANKLYGKLTEKVSLSKTLTPAILYSIPYPDGDNNFVRRLKNSKTENVIHFYAKKSNEDTNAPETNNNDNTNNNNVEDGIETPVYLSVPSTYSSTYLPNHRTMQDLDYNFVFNPQCENTKTRSVASFDIEEGEAPVNGKSVIKRYYKNSTPVQDKPVKVLPNPVISSKRKKTSSVQTVRESEIETSNCTTQKQPPTNTKIKSLLSTFKFLKLVSGSLCAC